MKIFKSIVTLVLLISFYSFQELYGKEIFIKQGTLAGIIFVVLFPATLFIVLMIALWDVRHIFIKKR